MRSISGNNSNKIVSRRVSPQGSPKVSAQVSQFFMFPGQERGIHENGMALRKRLGMMEEQHKKDLQQIQVLENRVQKLRSEVEFLKEEKYAIPVLSYNHSKSSSMETVQLIELQQKCQSFKEGIDDMKIKAWRGSNQIEEMRKKNLQLKGTLKRYQSLLRSSQQTQSSQNRLNTSQPGIRLNTTNSISSRGNQFGGLLSAIDCIINSKSAYSLCANLIKELRSIFKAKVVQIYLLDLDLKNEYKSEAPVTAYQSEFRIDSRDVVVHYNGDEENFCSIEEMLNKRRKGRSIVGSESEGKFSVRCQRAEGQNVFNAQDEGLMECIIGMLLLKFRSLMDQKNALKGKELLNNIVGSVANISSSSSHREIANAIFREIPQYMNCKYAGITFVDPINNTVFCMTQIKSSATFSDIVTKYPQGCGLTGEQIGKKENRFILNPKWQSGFLPDIDNNVCCQPLRNMFIAPLYNKQGNTIGALQLLNLTTTTLSSDDLSKIEAFLPLISASTLCANKQIEMYEMIIDAKKKISDVTNVLNGAESSDVDIIEF